MKLLPWWNDECREAHDRYLRTRPLGMEAEEVKTACKEMRKAITNAKQGYWHDLIDGAQTDRDPYRMAGWSNATTKVAPPKLMDRLGLDEK